MTVSMSTTPICCFALAVAPVAVPLLEPLLEPFPLFGNGFWLPLLGSVWVDGGVKAWLPSSAVPLVVVAWLVATPIPITVAATSAATPPTKVQLRRLVVATGGTGYGPTGGAGAYPSAYGSGAAGGVP